jgi:DNA-binding transcriptional regulator PaaX
MKVKKSLGYYLLLALEKSVDGFVRIEDFTYNSHIYARGYERNLKKSSLAKTIKRLKEKGLIDFVDDQKLALKLTDSGKEQAILASLKDTGQIWDGKWRIVFFDIPEKRRKSRDILRMRLKQWGFEPWQKSIWASKKNCIRPLGVFIKSVGIQEWVKVGELENIN